MGQRARLYPNKLFSRYVVAPSPESYTPLRPDYEVLQSMLCSGSGGLRELEIDGDPRCRIYSVARQHSILDTREWMGKAAPRLLPNVEACHNGFFRFSACANCSWRASTTFRLRELSVFLEGFVMMR